MQIHENKITFFDQYLSSDRKESVNKTKLVKDFCENNFNSRRLLDFLKYLEFVSCDKTFIQSYKKQLIDNTQAVSIYSLISQDFLQREQRKQYNKEFILKDLSIIANQIYEEDFISTDNINVTSDVNKQIIDNDWKDEISLLVQATFSHILLDIYMPTQDRLLELLGKELNYNSLGQNFLGKILDNIKSFTAANVHYNLSGYISQTMGTNNFSTTFSTAKNKLNNEVIQAGNDVEVIDNVLSMLHQQLNDIQSNTELTAEQITNMSTMLSGYISSLEESKKDLLSLMNLLNSLSIVENNSGGFEVIGPSNWQSSLVNLEGAVINGVQNESSSGLLNFFNTCMNQQLTYGDLAQSQQLTLQLELTAIQQEWTIISGSLRILNKIFMNLAAQIKR